MAAPANESRRDAYGASVLVFDRDGATPQGNASPVVAAGFDSPSGLVWDSQRKRAWLAGQDEAGTAGVKVIRRTVDGQGAVVGRVGLMGAVVGHRARLDRRRAPDRQRRAVT